MKRLSSAWASSRWPPSRRLLRATAAPAPRVRAPSVRRRPTTSRRREGPGVLADALAVHGGHRVHDRFDNQDAAPHNIAIKDASGAEVFKGEIVTQHEDHQRGPGAGRGHLHVPVRGPSRHDGHDHGPVAARSPRSTPRSRASFARWLSTPDARCPIAADRRALTRGHRCSRSIDLAKRYGPVVALDGATFTAAPGRIVGFLGPNGAGKTTTMRCIFGLARPDRGEVRWKGAPVDRDARLRFGYMPEQRGLYPRMRVGEQLSYFAQQHGLAARDARCGRRPAGSSGWASATARSRSSRSSRTATSSASSWPSRWPTSRSCSSSTSRSPGSTRSASRR